MRLTKTTGWSLGTAGLCVALATGGWFALVDPQRAEAAESREQTVSAVQANQLLEQRIEQLRADFANLPARQAQLAAIRQALPAEPALAQLIRDVHARSTDAGTALDSVVTGTPVAVVDPDALVAAAAPVDEAAPVDGAAPAEGAAPAPEPSAAPSDPAVDPAVDPSVVGAPATAAVTQAPVLAAIPVTITSEGDFSATTLLLKNLQADMPRALLVDQLTFTVVESVEEGAEPGQIQTVLTGRVFVFVDPAEIEFPSSVPTTEPETTP